MARKFSIFFGEVHLTKKSKMQNKLKRIQQFININKGKKVPSKNSWLETLNRKIKIYMRTFLWVWDNVFRNPAFKKNLKKEWVAAEKIRSLLSRQYTSRVERVGKK